MRDEENELTRLVRSVAVPMGYELVGVEYFQRGKGGGLLRVYIDHEEGITLDDCGAVSKQLSGVLDVEDPIPGHYDLEVSSPGIDRPLFSSDHFERFRGHRARLRLATKLDGRRKLEGLLAGVDGDAVLIDVDGEVMEVSLALIESARLVPEF
jgi:ribosome maturation factor RimP